MASPLPDPVPLPEIHRVLVTKLRHHGDVLLSSPVFTSLARAIPGVEIDALVYRGTEPVLDGHPAIAQVHTIDRTWKEQGVVTQGGAEIRLLRQLRARRYDLLVHLTEHARGLHLARLLRPRWSVTRERATHARLWQRHFTHFYRQPEAARRHTVEANLDALRRIGIYPEPADKRLVMVPGAQAHARGAALLAQHGLATRGFIHLHPGSRWLFKCWPAERTAELLDRMVADGHSIVVTGAPDERELELVATILASIAPESRTRVIDLTGQLTLPELACIAHHARAFVGVDSAPMHIAAAMGTPVVALFGPSGEMQWGPWGVASRVIASNSHGCRPCGLDGCGGSKVSDCLTTLPVDRVHEGLRQLLAETAQGAA